MSRNAVKINHIVTPNIDYSENIILHVDREAFKIWHHPISVVRVENPRVTKMERLPDMNAHHSGFALSLEAKASGYAFHFCKA